MSLHVPGSNENRPEIKVGNTVLMRINTASAWKLAQRISGTPPEVFEAMEVTGEVTSYKLKTEIATIRFKIHENPTPESQFSVWQSLMATEGIDPITSCEWHVRFTFNASGLNFAKEACIALMKNSSIRSALTWDKPPLRLVQEPIGADLDKDLSAIDLPGCNGRTLCPFTALEGLNQRQRMAVIQTCIQVHRGRSIYGQQLMQENRNLPPFIIYGPPGTGKTKTVCHIIEAVALSEHYELQKESRGGRGMYILVTAPSDAAADVIAMRLLARANLTMGKSSDPWENVKIRRLNWWQRSKESLPLSLSCISFVTEDGDIRLPTSHSELRGCDDTADSVVIVVTTCATAGVIRHFDDHSEFTSFDLVVIDEASQAIEAETYVPLSLCKPIYGVMVLAGDPKQLGASMLSPFYHLDNAAESLLDKLLRGEAYNYFSHPGASNQSCEEALAGKYMTTGVFLIDNYRSHRDILALSILFYQSELVEQADRLRTGALVNKWTYRSASYKGKNKDKDKVEDKEKDKNKEKLLSCTTMSVGVNGQHQSEEGNPSYFNVTEAEEILCLVQAL